MRWILKIILFPISIALSILIAFLSFLLGIGTAILYLLMMFCIFGAIASFFTKRGYHRDRSIDIRIFVKPIRNTNGWNSCYSRFNGSERSNTLYLENDIYI